MTMNKRLRIASAIAACILAMFLMLSIWTGNAKFVLFALPSVFISLMSTAASRHTSN